MNIYRCLPLHQKWQQWVAQLNQNIYFYYNEQEDYFVCPMGQHMTRVGSRYTKTGSGYISEIARYRSQRCEGCKFKIELQFSVSDIDLNNL
jgi:hypothetical protein